MSLNTVKILGVSVVSTSASSVLSEITDFVAKSALMTSLLVFTPNPEFLVEASRDNKFKNLLNKADINLPDGIGLVWASRLLDTPVKERISGADVVEKLLEMGNKQGWRVGIAGARRSVAAESEELIKNLQEKYPSINFVNLDGTNSKFNPPAGGQDSRFNVIFACHGMKKQEEWIWENKDKIEAYVFMGIGGSLDFITGFSRRAPPLMRQIGLEWLWRGLQKPTHFKRIWKAVFVFGWLVIKEKFFISR